MDVFRFGSINEVIRRFEKIKEKGDNFKVMNFTIDFDDEGNTTKSIIAPDDGCILAKQAKAIVISEDDFISHIQLFSTKQDDIENIKAKGKMHDIILLR